MNRSDVEQWEASAPALSGRFDDDAKILSEYWRAGEELIAALPARPDRAEHAQAIADRVFEQARGLRIRFMDVHADAVYDDLTEGGALRPRLAELAFAAADRFPGLVPTRAQIDHERGFGQADKDGREIDQGVFFRGLLRSCRAGAHLIDTMRLPCPRASELLGEFRREGSVELQTLSLERRGPAAHITVHNDHCLNAEDDNLIADMETATDLALLNEDCRVGVLRGGTMTHPRYAGKRVFCAGINLGDLLNGRISFVDFLLKRELGYINKIARGLLAHPDDVPFPDRSVEMPWIAAVDSFAIGGGMQLLLVFDRVIAADDAFFSLPAAKEGIVPGVANLRLARLTGSRLARRVILGGARIKATDPEALLVCDEVVAPDALLAAVEAAIGEFDNPAVVANRRMLSLVEEDADAFRQYMAEFAYVQATRLYSDDVLANLARGWSGAGRRE